MFTTGKILGKASTVVSMISYIGVAAITLLNVADVLMTKLAEKPIDGSQEITEQLLMITVVSAFAYAQTKKAHVSVTLVIKHLPRFIKFPLYGLMALLATATVSLMSYSVYLQIGVAMEKNLVTEILGIPKYPFYAIEFVCFLMFAIVMLYDTILIFMATGSKKYADIVTSSWTD